MPDDKYILVDCKCGRKVRALISELDKGIICPRCNSHLGRDSVEKKNEEAHPENAAEAPIGDVLVEKCPSCSADVKISYRKKYLAQCQGCSKFFLRKKNPEISIENAEKTEKFVNPVTGETVSPLKNNSPPEMQTAPQNQETAAQPTEPSPDTPGTPDPQPIIPPTEKQMNILNSLGICGTPETSKEASEIILTVSRIIEDAAREYNTSFHLFPYELKSAIISKIAKSELFPRIYFGEESLKYEELQPFIEEVIRDIELQKALKTYISQENLEAANEYIKGFAECVFGIPLDPEIVKIMALKAFARGFGLKLKPFGNVIYTSSGDTVKKLNKSDQRNLTSFYTRQNKINHSLEKLFIDSGFIKPDPAKSAAGCFFLIAGAIAISAWTAIQAFNR